MKFRNIAVIGAGTTLEIYDTYVFAFLLTTINQLFFPSQSENWGSIAAFSILFVVRPISAVFWGILGDRRGKFLVFKNAILFMAFATLTIGLLPTHSQIGIWAPILLLLMRVIQGISISGEFGSALVFCYEQTDPKDRFKNISFLYVFIVGGILIASTNSYLVTYFNIDPNIAWRIPFLLGGIAGIILYFLRRNLQVTEQKYPEVNFKRLFFDYKKLLISMIALFLLGINWFYFSAIFAFFNHHLDKEGISHLSIQSTFIVIISSLVFGKIISHIQHKKIMPMLYTAIILMYGLSLILIYFINEFTGLKAFYYMESIVAGLIFVCVPILVLDRLPTETHSSSYNIPNNFSTCLLVGFMPYLMNGLSISLPVHWASYLFVINLVISLVALFSIEKIKA